MAKGQRPRCVTGQNGFMSKQDNFLHAETGRAGLTQTFFSEGFFYITSESTIITKIFVTIIIFLE